MFQKLAVKAIRILEISCSKSNLRTNLEKTGVLMIFEKYFHIYEIIIQLKNHLRKNYENESRKGINFINFRQYNCVFT